MSKKFNTKGLITGRVVIRLRSILDQQDALHPIYRCQTTILPYTVLFYADDKATAQYVADAINEKLERDEQA
jgi:hypothetical protein